MIPSSVRMSIGERGARIGKEISIAAQIMHSVESNIVRSFAGELFREA